VPVSRSVVLEICRRFVVTRHPVNKGTIAAPDWVIEYRPFVPDELTVRNLIRESLPRRAPVAQAEAAPAPAEPVAMLPDDHPEIMAGRRAAARHAMVGDERLKEEIAAGERRLKQFQA
jgi:hypothetical protein